jgi:uncharacterized membrane protein YgcG
VTRTVLLGLLGLVLAVAVGFGVHLVTRSTIALPVVQLEPPRAPATTATTTERTTSERTTTEDAKETEPAGPPVSTEDREREARTETDDDGSSGRGRGRGRSGGDSGGDNSGPGGGGDDD